MPYIITDDCVECGECLSECQYGAIEAASPYMIKQNDCVFCAACVWVCTAKAIHHVESPDDIPEGKRV